MSPRATVPAPAPGLHPGTQRADYFSWDAASNTALGKLRRSAAHCRAYLDGLDEDSKAKRQGRPIHAAVLEPDDYDRRYVVAEQCNAPTQRRTRCSKGGQVMTREHGWTCSQHAEGLRAMPVGEVITEADRVLHLAVRDAVLRHPLAKVLLEVGHPELAATWQDRQVPVTCKALLDWYDRERNGGTIMDLKSTEDASRREFQRAVWRWGYHRQAPFYMGGVHALELPCRHFVIVAVEKKKPHGVAVYRFTNEVIRQARPHLRALLEDFKRCQDSGVWPGYREDEVQDLEVPEWAWNVMDDEAWEIQQRGAA